MTAPEAVAQAVTLRYKLRGLSREQLADARARLARGLVDVAGRCAWLTNPTVQVSNDDHALIVKVRVVPPHADDPVRDAHDAVITAASAGRANLPIGKPVRTRCHEALPYRVA